MTLRQRCFTGLLCWCVVAAVMLAFAAATGRLAHQMVPDSPSYLQYPLDSLDAALRSIRTPGYPIFLKVAGSTLGLGAVPLLHLLLHATAASLVIGELRRWGTPGLAAWAAGLTIALGNTPLDNLAIVSTDAPAASLGVMAAVALMRWVRLQRALTAAVAAVALALLAITIRPAYLFMIPWLVVAGTLLLWRQSQRRDLRSLAACLGSAMVLGLAASVPIVAWMGLRGAVVGDFGILPFGHISMSGITVQLVSQEELLATSGEPRELAQQIVRAQARFEAAGGRLAEGDPGATMTIESRYNNYVWQIVVPAAEVLHGRDIIASHNAIGELNRSIIARYPARYIRWLLLAARRAAWGTAANVAMHPIFLPCLILAALLELARALAAVSRSVPSSSDTGTDVLLVIALSYFAMKTLLVILSSPPVGRFADAAAIFIPAWLAARAVQYFAHCRLSLRECTGPRSSMGPQGGRSE